MLCECRYWTRPSKREGLRTSPVLSLVHRRRWEWTQRGFLFSFSLQTLSFWSVQECWSRCWAKRLGNERKFSWKFIQGTQDQFYGSQGHKSSNCFVHGICWLNTSQVTGNTPQLRAEPPTGQRQPVAISEHKGGISANILREHKLVHEQGWKWWFKDVSIWRWESPLSSITAGRKTAKLSFFVSHIVSLSVKFSLDKLLWKDTLADWSCGKIIEVSVLMPVTFSRVSSLFTSHVSNGIQLLTLLTLNLHCIARHKAFSMSLSMQHNTTLFLNALSLFSPKKETPAQISSCSTHWCSSKPWKRMKQKASGRPHWKAHLLLPKRVSSDQVWHIKDTTASRPRETSLLISSILPESGTKKLQARLFHISRK